MQTSGAEVGLLSLTKKSQTEKLCDVGYRLGIVSMVLGALRAYIYTWLVRRDELLHVAHNS